MYSQSLGLMFLFYDSRLQSHLSAGLHCLKYVYTCTHEDSVMDLKNSNKEMFNQKDAVVSQESRNSHLKLDASLKNVSCCL